MDSLKINQGLDSVDIIKSSEYKTLSSAGYHTIFDLLLYIPRDYHDRTIRIPFTHYATAPVNTVVTVKQHLNIRTKQPSRAPLIIKVADDTADAQLVCFGRHAIRYLMPIGHTFNLTGSFTMHHGQVQASRFEFEEAPAASRASTDDAPRYSRFHRIVPIYQRIGTMSAQRIDEVIQYILNRINLDTLDAITADETSFVSLPLAAAIRAIHQPTAIPDAHTAYQQAVRYELLLLQFRLQRGRRHSEENNTPSPLPISPQRRALHIERDKIIDALPFHLTADQLQVLETIYTDMSSPRPMKRLLQGDVGVGKTLVALLAIIPIIAQQGQCAFMVPTELLAHQQYISAQRILAPLNIHIALLTGSTPKQQREATLLAVRRGHTTLLIGTHALFGASVRYNKLELIIIDEQHRFGVHQRTQLTDKGARAHQLYMTATPIPRSLALAIYGKFDVSAIRSRPQGRRKIRTHLVRQTNETRAYSVIRNEINKGHQAYIVYPRIERDNDSRLRSAESMYAYLRTGPFNGYCLACIHSKLTDEQKIEIMTHFVEGRVHILVATSVIEVGVDVPNATCMLIDHAERFGLATLHQLRGRVGRSHYQSYAFLMYADSDTLPEYAKSRLKALYDTDDGFLISEADLAMRGPGDIVGFQQSGLRLRVAKFPRDLSLLMEARQAALRLLDSPPTSRDAADHAMRALAALFSPPA